MISLGSQSQLGIGISIVLKNQFSGVANQVAQSMANLKRQANSAVLGAMRDYRNHAAGMATAYGAVTYGLYNMAKAGAEFEHKINQTAIVGGKALGRTRQQLSSFAQGLTSQYSPTEIAQAMFENSKAGVTQGMEKITRYQIAAATAAGEQLGGEGGVAEKLLGIMNAMDLSLNDFGRISNATVAAANASMASVYSIGESMEYAAFTSKTFNISMEATLAMIAKMAQAKITGSSAGTAINNMLTQLSKSLGPFATKKTIAAWGMLGLNKGQMRNMANSGNIFGVVEAIEKASAGLPPIQRKDILSRLFNTRGDRGLEAMFTSKNGNKTLESLYGEIRKGVTEDVAMKQSKAMMNDLFGDMKLLGNEFQKLGIALSHNPVLRVFVGILTKAVHALNWIANTRLGGILLGLGSIVVTTGFVIWSFKAALMAATLSLNSFARMQGTTGFGNLMRAGLGMAGSTNLAAKGIALNSLGRATVAAGQTINIGGKIYKGGQFLPKGFQAGVAGASSWGSKALNLLGIGAAGSTAGSFVAKGSGFFSKALPWLGRMGSFAGKWLPVIGWIWGIYDVLSGMMKSPHTAFDDARDEKDYAKLEYLRNQQVQNMWRDLASRDPNWDKTQAQWQQKYGSSLKGMQQTLIINLNDRKIAEHNFEFGPGKFDKDIDFNSIH